MALRARSLQQFVVSLASKLMSCLDGQQGDFSEWIAGVFHDHRLASDVRKVERYRLGHLSRLQIFSLIKARMNCRRESIISIFGSFLPSLGFEVAIHQVYSGWEPRSNQLELCAALLANMLV